MDFVVRLPNMSGKFNFLWVVVDRLTKSAHLILVRVYYNAEQLARINGKEIVYPFPSSQIMVPFYFQVLEEVA